MKLLTELDSLDNVKDGETRKLITKTTSSGSGNVVSSVSVSGDTITYTKGVTAVTDANYVHTDNNFTTTLKNKLDGIASGAEVNQNAFSNVKVGSTTIAADGKTDTLELAAGSNITLTPDATSDKVTIAAAQPTVNNGQLTIQKNGTNVATFTANQSGNATANITVPTKVSELTNDSGYVNTNTTYTFATGDNTGQIKITPSGGTAQNITVKDIAGPVYDIITITKPLLVGTDWMDTGIVGNDLGSTGSFIVQLTGANSGQGGLWGEMFTGITTNYAGTTNSGESDEILLQNTGHAPNSGDLFLRWIRTGRSEDGNIKLQIASYRAFTQSQNMVFKFRKMI